MKRTIASKLTRSAAAVKIDPAKPANRRRHADQNGDFRHVQLENTGNGHLRDSTRDSAEYIAVLSSQLQRIAETNGHQFLAYLINMVVLEAWRIAGPDADHPDKQANGAGGGGV
jgi:hypothetical protein